MNARRLFETKSVQIAGGVVAALLGLGTLRLAAGLLDANDIASQLLPWRSARAATLDPSSPAPKPAPGTDVDQALDVASYTLHARLDAARHVIAGRGEIRWRNASSKSVGELWFHLYLNAFKNDKTLFLRSPYGAGRNGERPTDWGYIDVKRLVARELANHDLWPGAAHHSPGDPDDQTDIRVPLPSPVPPGGHLTLEMTFEAKLPSVVERTGYAGSFHFAGQWFPKLARLEPDGVWAHFAFDARSEFYADYGRYDVTIDVPETMRVGATGRRVSERVASGRRVVRHVIDPAHDFAWTAWDGFVERQATVDGVSVRLLYPAAQSRGAEVTLQAITHALPYMNRRYGRYPYPTLTVVSPPDRAEGAGGMEYPSLITTGGRWYLPYLGIRAFETVAVHELGHQWFYGTVGTNEHAWPFLDEGVNSYAETDTLSTLYGSGSALDAFGLRISEPAVMRAVAAARAHDTKIAQGAARFPGFSDLAALVYSRTATLLRTLGAVYGQDRLAAALGSYTRRHRFGHPGPEDFLQALRDGLGEDAERVARLALFERGWVDYVARDLQTTRVERPGGVFDKKSGHQVVTREPAPTDQWIGRVLVFRHGTLHLPVDVDLYAEDGTRTRRHWDGAGDWTALDYRGSSPLVGVWIDPEHKISLDQDLTNNALRSDDAAEPRVYERASYWAFLLLSGFGS